MATTPKRSSREYSPRHARTKPGGGGSAPARPRRTGGRSGGLERRGGRRAGAGPQRGFFRRYWWVFALAPVVLVLLGFGALAFAYTRIELPRALPPVQTTFVYDRNDQLLSTFHGSVDRTLIPFGQMPRHLREAVIAVEDARFYEHDGVDLRGTVRAGWRDLVAQDAVQGGSTLTQQLVKRVYAGRYVEGENGVTDYVIPPRTVKEKLREVLLAIKVERAFTKDEILARYLNTVYFGHGAYGIEAAARTYFGVPARRLTLPQSATLAGILTAPEAYDPIDHPFDTKFRRDFALDRMVEFGYLDDARAAKLKRQPCCGVPVEQQQGSDAQIEAPGDAEYFVQYVRERLARRYGSAAVFGGGLRVQTTLDLGYQAAAEQAIEEALPSPQDPGASLVAIEPATGHILAMAGGRDFETSQLNLATFRGGTGRQAGSAFKAFTLAEAMERGFDLDSQWYGPNTITIDDPVCDGPEGPWEPENAEGGGGTYSLQSATAHSVNTVYAQLVVELGPSSVVDMAHRLGIRSDLPAVCAITLGSVAVNPTEMTNAYATLAARGMRHRPNPLLQVRSAGGRIDPDAGLPKGSQVLDQNVADLVTYALQDVVEYGTGASARLSGSWPVAGKTGTAQDNVDAWFCGYTVQIAACVWVGYPKGQIPLEDIQGVSEVFGGTIPADIWRTFMEAAMEGKDSVAFRTPSFTRQTVTPSAEAPIPPPPEPSPSPEPEPSASPEPSPSPSSPPPPSPSPPSPPPSPPSPPSPTSAPAAMPTSATAVVATRDRGG
ncbi:MAG TPA: transglycosylase domain-containing protein [Actinomycetota bacterium]|nr:transglycosylase domain-containing protein [Actinomycetota bacterium]